jgi:hypothetical protein
MAMMDAERERPPMIWIGGAQGSGKTTIAWRLSRAYDLPLHPIDLWAYDHRDRLPAGHSLDQQLARGTVAAADDFESVSRLRLDLVLDDLLARDLRAIPAIVEGPQLMPSFADEIPAGWCVWLAPDPERTRLARQERLGRVSSGSSGRAGADSSQARRLHRLVERDAVIAARVRASGARLGRPVVEVPTRPDWAAVAAAVESALGPALRSTPRLAPGAALSRQRRHENAAAADQGRRWMADAGLATVPDYPFGCECGTSGCDAVWMATTDEYAARVDDGRSLIAHGA